MKLNQAMVMLAVVLAGAAPLAGQTRQGATNDPFTLDLLRRTIEAQKRNPGKIVRPIESGSAAKTPETLELERQYLEGKITAKQFQKALEEAEEQREKAVAAALTPAPKPTGVPTLSPKAAAAAGVTAATPAPAFPTPPPPANPNQKRLTEVEMRIDEMLRKKAERERLARETAAASTNNPTGGPLTKRQRLDALLRQVLEGKLTDAEYKVQRAKIATEPD